jgi:disulfide oxidoreductase YuzD
MILNNMVDIKTPQYKNPDKNHDKPFFRYGGYSICMSPTDKYTEMVEVSRGPKVGRALIGRKYINHFFAMKAIDTFKTERMINKQITSVVATLESEGYDVDAALEAVSNDSFLNF